MQRKDTRLYRVKTVAEIYDVSVATIYRAIETGKLPALKLGRGRGTIRIPETALDSFTAACTAAVNAHAGPTDGGQQPPAPPVVLTCTECGWSFEPSTEDVAAGRTGCPDPDCRGWTFWAELREPARRSGAAGDR